MKTLDEIMDRFTGPSILHDLAGLLREHDSEFPDTERSIMRLSRPSAPSWVRPPRPVWMRISRRAGER